MAIMQIDTSNMRNAQKSGVARKVGVLLFDGFSNLCLANTVEPLRAANTQAGRVLYTWQHLALRDEVLHSSSGLPVQPGALSGQAGDILCVIPSYGHRALATAQCCRALREAARHWPVLIGMDTGSWLLAAAGLLDGHRATCHWDILGELAEGFPEVDACDTRYVIDGNRMSSGGATTTLELMLDLIGRHHGTALSMEVAALFMFGERDPRHDPLFHVPGDRLVRAAAAIMRREVETPPPVPDIAARLGVSRRRLETAFRKHMDMSPALLARSIRLAEARRLAEQTTLSVAEIAGRCGYEDAAAMTRAFRAQHGTTPQALRAAQS